jgi:DNA polymerase (family X)
MTPGRVAAVLHEIAALTEVVGGDPFRARAFAGAARRLEGASFDLVEMARAGSLREIPGVGSVIGETIRELAETGRSGLHERLLAEAPAGLRDVMRIKGLGPRKVRTLYQQLGVDSLDALEAAITDGRVAKLSGFGEKTAVRILQGIAFVRGARGRRRMDQVWEVARRLEAELQDHPAVNRAELAGDLRRWLEVVASVDLVAAAADRDAVFEWFARFGADAGVLDDGRMEARFADGFAARLAVTDEAAFGAAVLWWTGSDEHRAQLQERAAALGMRFGEDGLSRGGERVETPDEDAAYAALGLPPIPPELREGWGEVEAAERGALPRLLELEDLRGTFHCHTTYSDGLATVAEMAEGARERGWSYLGIADHSQSAGYAGGLPVEAVRRQALEIDAWNRSSGGKGKKRFRVFKGTESDIQPDGSLDYPDDVLAGFDYVVGSIHSAFGLGEREQTDRLVRAVSNPRLTILGHATGRLLLGRTGYPVDVRAVIDAAAEHGVAVEINADPHRLDIDWRHARYAAERGVLVPINPDAHSVGNLDLVAWGVAVARKGWLSPENVLNTRELKEVEELLAERVQGRAP